MKNILQLSHDAATWYYHSNQPYHNWAHACQVADNVMLITDLKASDKVLLAAYWHDAVYVPGAGKDANEQCSAAALINTSHALGYTDQESRQSVSDAAQLIRFTSVEYHLHPNSLIGDLAVLLDADLGSLAAPYEQFLVNQKNIIKENNGTFEEHRGKSAAFLTLFLTCRPFIYHTAYGQEHWEEKARENIMRYQAES